MEKNISEVKDAQARRFLDSFLRDRAINRKYYELVPEDKFDYRMVDTPIRKSDSPRESLAHQIDTQRDYIGAIKTGELKYGVMYDDLIDLSQVTKKDLLAKLDEADRQLIDVLADPDIANKRVKVSWADTPVSAVTVLWSLDSHEILHTGWNLALMDHLNIPRFQKLNDMWG